MRKEMSLEMKARLREAYNILFEHSNVLVEPDLFNEIEMALFVLTPSFRECGIID